MADAIELIRRHGLVPHPEGGHFAEVHRASTTVHPVDDPARVRPAYTTIVFLLGPGDVSAWHRVAADETWLFHEGCDLTLYRWHDDGTIDRETIGRDAGTYQATIPAGTWFAAAPVRADGFSFVSCVVGPGFTYDDFELLTAEIAAGRPFGSTDAPTVTRFLPS